jgi:hypothetical protein
MAIWPHKNKSLTDELSSLAFINNILRLAAECGQQNGSKF